MPESLAMVGPIAEDALLVSSRTAYFYNLVKDICRVCESKLQLVETLCTDHEPGRFSLACYPKRMVQQPALPLSTAVSSSYSTSTSLRTDTKVKVTGSVVLWELMNYILCTGTLVGRPRQSRQKHLPSL